MMNQIGASKSVANDDNVGTTSALVMGASDPVVAGYNKNEGVVILLFDFLHAYCFKYCCFKCLVFHYF